ncbi:unnamed protein product [Amoebophrya sp. A120]|nr:unnamed protein product [Amoebophrya sp. A120]|eukprot:GSA120T00018650001.1
MTMWMGRASETGPPAVPGMQRKKTQPRSLEPPDYHPTVMSPGDQKKRLSELKAEAEATALKKLQDEEFAKRGPSDLDGESKDSHPHHAGEGLLAGLLGSAPSHAEKPSHLSQHEVIGPDGEVVKIKDEEETNIPKAILTRGNTAALLGDSGKSRLGGNKSSTPSLSRAMTTDKRVLEQAVQDQGLSLKQVGALDLEDADELLAAAERRQHKTKFTGDFAIYWLKGRIYAQQLLLTQKFDLIIGFVILVNSVTIGWETQAEVKNEDTTAFVVLEHLFLVIYSFELWLRFYAFGWRCLKSGWVMFDAVLVGVGILANWFLPIMFSHSPDELGPILVLRVLRLLRLARAVRLLIAFRSLWMLVRGLLTSATTMSYTVVLIFLLMYVSAVLAAEVITKNRDLYLDDAELLHIVDNNFSGLFVIMVTLVQFVTLDSAGAIYLPLIKREPALALFFMAFILIVSIALMNLVTAVIVEGAIAQAEADKEVQLAYKAERLQRMMPELRAMFELFDEDQSGELTKEEMVSGLESNEDLKNELSFIMGTVDPESLFEMLDTDGGGKISIDEFCTQIVKCVTSARPIELERILKLVRDVPVIRKEMMEIKHAVHDDDTHFGGGGGGGHSPGGDGGSGPSAGIHHEKMTAPSGVNPKDKRKHVHSSASHGKTSPSGSPTAAVVPTAGFVRPGQKMSAAQAQQLSETMNASNEKITERLNEVSGQINHLNLRLNGIEGALQTILRAVVGEETRNSVDFTSKMSDFFGFGFERTTVGAAAQNNDGTTSSAQQQAAEELLVRSRPVTPKFKPEGEQEKPPPADASTDPIMSGEAFAPPTEMDGWERPKALEQVEEEERAAVPEEEVLPEVVPALDPDPIPATVVEPAVVEADPPMQGWSKPKVKRGLMHTPVQLPPSAESTAANTRSSLKAKTKPGLIATPIILPQSPKDGVVGSGAAAATSSKTSALEDGDPAAGTVQKKAEDYHPPAHSFTKKNPSYHPPPQPGDAPASSSSKTGAPDEIDTASAQKTEEYHPPPHSFTKKNPSYHPPPAPKKEEGVSPKSVSFTLSEKDPASKQSATISEGKAADGGGKTSGQHHHHHHHHSDDPNHKHHHHHHEKKEEKGVDRASLTKLARDFDDLEEI